MVRLGVVSFLNSKPLIAGLRARPELDLAFAVPAALTGELERGAVDVALVPIVDVLRSAGRLQPLSDACIACDGETMTVRVFAQQPPHRLTKLYVDGDSHTSVALARVLWHAQFGVELAVEPLPAGAAPADFPAVLLIGDKVVDPQRGSFAYEVDLGGAWRQMTGLPFVFAVWAQRRGELREADGLEIVSALNTARDEGVARAAEIAAEFGPQHGWAVPQAQRYLTRCLRYTLDERTRAGAEEFARHCAALGLAPVGTTLDWSAVLSTVSTPSNASKSASI